MPTTVLATRFNNLQQRISKILGTSSSSTPTFGYGQSFNSSSVVGDYDTNTSNTDLIAASDYAALYKDIVRARVHQVGASAFTAQDTPVGNFASGSADKVQESYMTYLEGLATQIESNKFNIGTDQFAVQSLLDASGTELSITRSQSSQGTWNGTLVHIFKVTFLSAAARRHFFNAGGKIRMAADITWAFSQSKTNDWKTLLSNMGIVSFGANGASSSTAVGSGYNVGNYNLTGSYQAVYQQTGSAYSGNSYQIAAQQLSSTEIQFRIYFSDTNVELIDEDVFGDLTSSISLVRPEGSVVYNGVETVTADITTPPIGQNLAVFNGLILNNPPSVTAFWSPQPGYVGSIQRLQWATTNTTSVSYSVTGPDGSLYTGNGNVNGTAAFAWQSAGSVSAVVTASGPGGIAQSSPTGTVEPAIVIPTYAIGAASATTLLEGQTGLNYGVSTTNVAVGTLLYWDTQVISGSINAADFQGSTLSGSVSLSGTGAGGAYVYRAAAADSTTEGTETFKLRLFTDVTRNDLVATSDLISISDISVNPPTYSLVSNPTNHPVYPSFISEGTYTATFSVSTTGVPDNTTLYWTTISTYNSPVYGPGINASDFTDNATTGTVTIVGGTAIISRSAVADLTTEGTEYFAIKLRTDSYSGTIVAGSSNRAIADTSQTPIIPNPSISAFQADPLTITAGDTFNISWTSLEATSVYITQTNPNGATSAVTETANGTRTLSPPAQAGNVSVTIKAINGPYQSGTSSINVTINAAPLSPSITGFSWSPSSITAGGNSVLTWSTANATSVTINPNMSEADPPISVGASGNNTYSFPSVGSFVARIEAYSSATGETAAQQTTVTATAPAPLAQIDTFNLSPASINTGQTSTLAWTTSFATSVRYRIPGVVPNFVSLGADGTTVITFPTAGDYTAELQAFSNLAGNTASSTTGISVANIVLTPTIDTFEFDPSSAGSGTTTLTWATTNAGRVALTGGRGGVNSNAAADGSLAYNATQDYSASISVYDTAGTFRSQQAASFTYVPLEADNTFSVSPTTVAPYGTILATVSGEPGRTYTIGGDFSSTGTISASGSTVVGFFKASAGSYSMTCTFSAGNAVSSITITVNPSSPSPTISFSPSTVFVGAALTLSWSSGTGTSTSVSWANPNGTTLGSSTALSGSTSVATSLSGAYTASISSSNAGGSGSNSTSATANTAPPAPIIKRFEWVPATIPQGGFNTLYWNVSNVTSISITGPMGNIPTGNAATGSFYNGPYNTPGYYTQNISVSGAGGSTSANASVTVEPPPPAAPTVTASWSPNPITTGQSSTFTWTSTNATSSTGTFRPQYFGAASGSYNSGTQTSPTTFQESVTVTGPGGNASASSRLTVTIPPQPPSISLYFTPSSGDTTTVFSAGWTITGTATGPISVTATSTNPAGIVAALPSVTSQSYPNYSGLSAGEWTINISATDSGGTSTATASITVAQAVTNATQVLGGRYVSIPATGSSGTAIFTATPTPDGGSWSYTQEGGAPLYVANTSTSGTNGRVFTVAWYGGSSGGGPQGQIIATWTNTDGTSASATLTVGWG